MKIIKLTFSILTVIITLFSSCKNDNNALVEIDLTEKGIPITIETPNEAEIAEGIGNTEFEGIKYYNYVIKKDNFILDIQMVAEEPEGDITDYIKRAKESANNEDGFSGFIYKEKSGFIYKIKNDEGTDYNFSYTIIKNNRAIEFSAGLNYSNYTEKEIELLFKAAKDSK